METATRVAKQGRRRLPKKTANLVFKKHGQRWAELPGATKAKYERVAQERRIEAEAEMGRAMALQQDALAAARALSDSGAGQPGRATKPILLS
eukprot:2968638-Lingulodinium_polyedra.AAC.1